MKIIKIEEIEYIELEQFSKPILIKLEGLSEEDIKKFELLDI